MRKYGRTLVYSRIQKLLTPERRNVLDLVNHGLAMIDDVIDSHAEPLKYLEHIQKIFQRSYSGENVQIANPEEKSVVDLGYVLNKLTFAKFPHFTNRVIGKHTYAKILAYWRVEEKNFQRRGNVLSKNTLDEITFGIGSLVGEQFLSILDPSRNPQGDILLAKAYGFAVKLADNLCDFREDIKKGFVNIPLEEIHHIRGVNIQNAKIAQIHLDKLSLSTEYIEKEYKRVKKVFDSADNLLLLIKKRRPIWRRKLQERLSLFGQFCHTWFNQAKEFAIIETLRNYDISLSSKINFLSFDGLREIEKKYEMEIGDVLLNSYEQEARNTRLVNDCDPNYSPYAHEKTSEANRIIRSLIQYRSEIKEVLDLGCDNGERTVELFEGKDLYGIESVGITLNEARKRKIEVYQGSMIQENYQDKANPCGRKFGLVSLVGEMINFVGLDVEDLLKRSVEQVKDKGYFLITSMHPKSDEYPEGKFVIWSHTKSTQGKWLLDEKKIPRTFLILSERELQQRLNKVVQKTGYNLVLQEKKIVNNYYEDIALGIYLLQKQ